VAPVARGYVFEGLVNFRDLGGIAATGGAIQPGRLFRSDSLSYATESDATRLVDAGLATIVDLRDTVEVDEFGRGPLASAPITYVGLPCTDSVPAESRSEYYFRLLALQGPALADLVRRLSAAGSLPAVVHCHIGCDRTGIVSAMLLGLAGVSDEDICADYARSTRANAAIRERSEDRRRHLGLPLMGQAYYDAWEPQPETMAAALDLVAREWRDMSGWAAAYGLTVDDVADLRAALVDPS
jgi:protein-tyrosine phosphatase